MLLHIQQFFFLGFYNYNNFFNLILEFSQLFLNCRHEFKLSKLLNFSSPSIFSTLGLIL